MNLNDCTIEIRPRSPWEAVDLGMLMAKRWYWQLIQVWCFVSLPVFVALAFLPAKYLWLQVAILWWLKPIFERPLLFILSKTVFGEYPSIREVMRAFPRLAWKQWILSLTLRRLSPSRSVDLPVLLLEGLAGSARAKRLGVLHREGTGPSSALTIYGVHIESFIAMAIFTTLLMFLPSGFEFDWDFLLAAEPSYWFTLLLNVLAFLAAALVAPFYVATGFALYLNRRVSLEAWDIEIAFKQLVFRREEKNLTRNRVKTPSVKEKLIVSLLAGLLLLTMPKDYAIAEDVSHVLNPQTSSEQIKEIKESEAFNRKAESYTPKVTFLEGFEWPEWLKFKESDENEDIEVPDLMQALIVGGEYLLWLLVITLIFILVYRYREWLERFGVIAAFLKRKNTHYEAPKILFGLEVSSESLPDDISAEAKRLWHSAAKREAIALLYRACLSQLLEYGVDLRSSDTERNCVKKMQLMSKRLQFESSMTQYFEHLTASWQQLAYGHIDPDEALFLEFCDRWPEVWQVQGVTHENS